MSDDGGIISWNVASLNLLVHDMIILSGKKKYFYPWQMMNWTCSWKWASFWLFCGHLYCYIFINFLLTCKMEISYATSINKIDYLSENALFSKKNLLENRNILEKPGNRKSLPLNSEKILLLINLYNLLYFTNCQCF